MNYGQFSCAHLKCTNCKREHLQLFFIFGINERLSLPFDFDVGVLHGSVIDMPNILPGGNASIVFPVSVETNRIAIASSTACWRFSATCKPNAYTSFVSKQTKHEIKSRPYVMMYGGRDSVPSFTPLISISMGKEESNPALIFHLAQLFY